MWTCCFFGNPAVLRCQPIGTGRSEIPRPAWSSSREPASRHSLGVPLKRRAQVVQPSKNSLYIEKTEILFHPQFAWIFRGYVHVIPFFVKGLSLDFHRNCFIPPGFHLGSPSKSCQWTEFPKQTIQFNEYPYISTCLRNNEDLNMFWLPPKK